MKILRFTALPLFLVAMLPVLLSCSSDDDPEEENVPKSYFHLEKSGFEISAEAQTLDVRIQTNFKVTTRTLADTGNWFGILYAGQENDFLNYQVSVDENTSPEERTARIIFEPVAGTVITSDAEIGGNTLVITQEGAVP